MSPTVSIILCTRNRLESLRRTIQSIGQCQIPSDLPAELVVVDNGSADGTSRAVEQMLLSNMPVRIVREPAPGQSHARNRGLAETEGEILLFTDDDVRVPRDWIEGMCRPILEGEADAVAGGVRFPPELDDKIRICRSWFASTEEIIATRPDRFVGANMAFSRQVLQQMPAFDIELGPGALGFGDETLFSFQIREAGYRLITRFDVAVWHHVDPPRIARDQLLKTARQMGRSKAYIAYHWRHAEAAQMPGRGMSDLARLWAHRIAHFRECFVAKQTSEWEMRLVERMEISRQIRRESGRPRNYARRGLVKLRGLQPISPQWVR
jgi:glycosyltransferase involved in cell wall biosynthesis